ncbi:YcxB family protein [Massilia pseudoviolaceinigra]|uniref:YcxB family protein n=1 Tax=Massilia pseudoviolaceinigra TaxID=3057165 RepID=UPI002796C95B|nr:YcxB family protein [Massilia sp. CCM 9206]MDQ1919879.1 YcxB family protein [Massilia sp. CCM 9206]
MWFIHPKPVGSRKPVAVLVQRERLDSASRVTIDAPLMPLPVLGPGLVPAAAPETVQFSVRYSLPEYVSFMWQHAGYIIRRRRIGTLATYWMQTKSTSSAALHFVTQGRSRNTYEFTIDTHGIVRASGSGVTLVPWGDVCSIRRYSRGFMMVLKRGTLPVPFRCLNAAQGESMARFGESVRAATRL